MRWPMMKHSPDGGRGLFVREAPADPLGVAGRKAGNLPGC
jgi:hypothetical protein